MSEFGEHPLANGTTRKATAWECARCGHENKSGSVDCAKCGHTPPAGREGRKYTPNESGGLAENKP
jgi:hypothetical protein